MKFTTQEMQYGHFGARSYRIEMDLTNPQRPMQRHIWSMEDGSVDVRNWIYAGQRTEADLLRHGYERLGV